jgi:penicillin-binding protein 2
LGIKIGLERFCQYGNDSGMFEKTGIDLPNEEAGLFPNESWYNRNYGRGNWGPGNVLNLSIGQGEITMSPLQLAMMYSAICTGGRRYRPHLVSIDPEQLRLTDSKFAKEDFEMLIPPLTGVINDPNHGTARGSRLWGQELKLAGKTGTSQNPHGLDHGLFVGIFPASAPEIVITIVVEHGEHGSSTARLVRDLVLHYLEFREQDMQPEMAAQLN